MKIGVESVNRRLQSVLCAVYSSTAVNHSCQRARKEYCSSLGEQRNARAGEKPSFISLPIYLARDCTTDKGIKGNPNIIYGLRTYSAITFPNCGRARNRACVSRLRVWYGGTCCREKREKKKKKHAGKKIAWKEKRETKKWRGKEKESSLVR